MYNLDTMRKTILIVEDDDNLRSSLRKILSINNFKVIEASDGAEALEMVDGNHPDLVLLDFGLPKVPGETVCVKIKESYPDIVVIALTEKSLTKDVVHGLQIGADDYMSKPFIEEELIARIDARLKKSTIKESSEEESVIDTKRFTLRESTAVIVIRIIIAQFIFIFLFVFAATLTSFLENYLGINELFPLYSLGLFVISLINVLIVLFIILRWRSEYAEITGDGVIKHSGIFYKNEQKFACNFVEAIKIEQDFWGLCLNYGTLELYDPALEEKIFLLNIANPKNKREIIEKSFLKKPNATMPFVASQRRK